VRRLTKERFVGIAAVALILATVSGSESAGASPPSVQRPGPTAAAPATHWCNTNGITCTEPYQNWEDFPWFDNAVSHGVHINEYIGHDEPSVLFYGNAPGSGNDNSYSLTLPTDPPVKPSQDGNGGTWNFQLRPTFWLGLDMCDDESAPNPAWSGAAYPNNPCTPDSDSNIFASDNAGSAKYIGKAPGGAFMEMQFYPPGWVKWPVGNSCDATRWCAALNIDSFSEDENTGTPNNATCLNSAGIEPVNFAYLTKDGTATTSADPLNGARFNLDPVKDFFMNSGDKLQVHMYDTPAGFTVVVDDLTAGTQGKMVASTANGFASVKFDPSASSCTLVPHPFHPMYSTSSPKTRLFWTAHTANVSVSDEIGHFEYCSKVIASSPILKCGQGGGFDTNNVDPQDDNYCLPVPGFGSTKSSLIHVTGCLGVLGDSDIDWDGVSYDARSWPGSNTNGTVGHLITPSPLRFSSPTTTGGANLNKVAFENILPRNEDFRPDDPFGGVQFNCQRHIANPADADPGLDCFNPPPQSRVYPFYVTTRSGGICTWNQVGGIHIPNLLNDFGGNSKSEYGSLLNAHYPTSGPGTVEQVYDTFHKNLSGNPCPA
jgi:hypothetical protein